MVIVIFPKSPHLDFMLRLPLLNDCPCLLFGKLGYLLHLPLHFRNPQAIR